MITIDGISGAWNYTIGPIVVWEGAKTLDVINFRAQPCVVVAKYIVLEHLGKVDFPHVLGFVLEEGGPGDPSLIIYSNQHRATVMRAAGAVAAARNGETVVVDGVNGKVFFEPDEATIEKYTELRKQGPPPEPPGMIDKLMKVATDFKSLDPSAIKGELISFKELGAVMDGVLSIWRGERLTNAQAGELRKFAKGKPVEASILGNLDRYDKVLDQLEAQQGEPVAVGAPAGGRALEAKGGAADSAARPERGAGGAGAESKVATSVTAT
ncbi:MAG TPA: hypothetical protein VHF22_14815, partial [Planctomycetota bacterium]|nr:hypothetical protein [Planctomycetota bacterium]